MCDSSPVDSVDVSSSTPDFSSGASPSFSADNIGLPGFDYGTYGMPADTSSLSYGDSLGFLPFTTPSMGSIYDSANQNFGLSDSNNYSNLGYGGQQGYGNSFVPYSGSSVPFSNIENTPDGFPLSPSQGSSGYGFDSSSSAQQSIGGLFDKGVSGLGNILGNIGSSIEKNPLSALMLMMNLQRNMQLQGQASDMQNRRNSAISGQQNALGPVQSGAINSLLNGAPVTDAQKTSIDNAINQQEQLITGQLQQQAVNRGMGADSQMVQQQINYAKNQLEQQRQSQYMAQQQQNMSQVLSQLGMSTNAIGSTINQMQSLPVVNNTSNTAAMLSQLSKGSQ